MPLICIWQRHFRSSKVKEGWSFVNLAGGAWKRRGRFLQPAPRGQAVPTRSSACRRVGMQNGYLACGVWETPIILLKTLSLGHSVWLSLLVFVAVFVFSSFVKLQQKPILKNHIHWNLLFKSSSPRSSCFEFCTYAKYIFFLIFDNFNFFQQLKGCLFR